MLELYQAYGDYTDMMQIFEDIVAGTAEELLGTTVIPIRAETSISRRRGGGRPSSSS